jgi:signal transduction histidine kinase
MLACYKSGMVGKSVLDDSLLTHLQISEKIKHEIISNELETYQDNVTLKGDVDLPTERTISPVRGRDGEINGWLLVFRDLTEEHQLSEFREDLTRMLVHDLRSPVVSIQGGLDMIEIMINDGDKSELMEMLNISRKGSEQVLGMINELLHLNRLESGKMVLQPVPVDPKSIFQEEIIFLRPSIQQAQITIEQDYDRDLPIIQADSGLLKRVIHNLLDNAIKFTPDKGVIRLWAKNDPDNPDMVLLGVQDNGPGIPADQLPNMFTKYFSVDGNKSRRRGTGLGLHFSRLAITAHKGEIWAESEIGKGTNVIIRLLINP